MDTLCDIKMRPSTRSWQGFYLQSHLYEIATYFCKRSSRDTWMHLQLMIFDAVEARFQAPGYDALGGLVAKCFEFHHSMSKLLQERPG